MKNYQLLKPLIFVLACVIAARFFLPANWTPVLALALFMPYMTKNKSIQSLKYSFIERLKRINCPEEVISEIIGLKKRTIFYKNEVSIEMKYSWLNQIIE